MDKVLNSIKEIESMNKNLNKTPYNAKIIDISKYLGVEVAQVGVIIERLKKDGKITTYGTINDTAITLCV